MYKGLLFYTNIAVRPRGFTTKARAHPEDALDAKEEKKKERKIRKYFLSIIALI